MLDVPKVDGAACFILFSQNGYGAPLLTRVMPQVRSTTGFSSVSASGGGSKTHISASSSGTSVSFSTSCDERRVNERWSLSLTVTTNGDAGRGLESCTVTFIFPVMVLGTDYAVCCGANLLSFQVGEHVRFKLEPSHFQPLVGLMSPGPGAKLNDVDGNHSGLNFVTEQDPSKIDDHFLSGTAIRPGIYTFDMVIETDETYMGTGLNGGSTRVVWMVSIFRRLFHTGNVIVASEANYDPGNGSYFYLTGHEFSEKYTYLATGEYTWDGDRTWSRSTSESGVPYLYKVEHDETDPSLWRFFGWDDNNSSSVQLSTATVIPGGDNRPPVSGQIYPPSNWPGLKWIGPANRFVYTSDGSTIGYFNYKGELNGQPYYQHSAGDYLYYSSSPVSTGSYVILRSGAVIAGVSAVTPSQIGVPYTQPVTETIGGNLVRDLAFPVAGLQTSSNAVTPVVAAALFVPEENGLILVHEGYGGGIGSQYRDIRRIVPPNGTGSGMISAAAITVRHSSYNRHVTEEIVMGTGFYDTLSTWTDDDPTSLPGSGDLRSSGDHDLKRSGMTSGMQKLTGAVTFGGTMYGVRNSAIAQSLILPLDGLSASADYLQYSSNSAVANKNDETVSSGSRVDTGYTFSHYTGESFGTDDNYQITTATGVNSVHSVPGGWAEYNILDAPHSDGGYATYATAHGVGKGGALLITSDFSSSNESAITKETSSGLSADGSTWSSAIEPVSKSSSVSTPGETHSGGFAVGGEFIAPEPHLIAGLLINCERYSYKSESSSFSVAQTSKRSTVGYGNGVAGSTIVDEASVSCNCAWNGVRWSGAGSSGRTGTLSYEVYSNGALVASAQNVSDADGNTIAGMALQYYQTMHYSNTLSRASNTSANEDISISRTSATSEESYEVS